MKPRRSPIPRNPAPKPLETDGPLGTQRTPLSRRAVPKPKKGQTVHGRTRCAYGRSVPRVDSRLATTFSDIGADSGLIFLALCGFTLAPRGCEPQALVLVLKTKDGESPVRALCLALEGWWRPRLLGGSRGKVWFFIGG
jgi:hypothetical protein